MAAANLAADKNHFSKTGRILLTADLAREYGFVDEDGKINGDMRKVNVMLRHARWNRLASIMPDFVRIPHFVLYFAGYKFLTVPKRKRF